MIIHRVKQTITTEGGIGSANTNPIIGGLCHAVYILAKTTGTTFKANIQDSHGFPLRQYDSLITTDIVDAQNWPIPMDGIQTIQITDASADGNFDIQILVRE